MTREDAIVDAYHYATGKSVDIASISTDKRASLTALAIKFNRQWQTEPGMEWDSLYDVVSAGAVTATNIFALAEDINFITTEDKHELNNVRVLHLDGVSYTDYTLVKSGQLYRYRNLNAVAFIREAGVAKVKFSKAFTSADAQFGGTIQVPAITKLPDLDTDGSDVLIDDYEWLPWRMAAQYAYSYKSLRDMYDDLLDAANDRMKGMMGRNTAGDETTSTGIDYFATMGNVGSTE